jgi:WD40 repeat protein
MSTAAFRRSSRCKTYSALVLLAWLGASCTSASPDLQQELADHADDVFSVAFRPDAHWFATASDNGIVKLWRVQPLF